MNEITSYEAWRLYDCIKHAVESQKEKLLEESGCLGICQDNSWEYGHSNGIIRSKCKEIEDALNHLKLAITYKFELKRRNFPCCQLSKHSFNIVFSNGINLKISEIALKNLSTMEGMLDFRVTQLFNYHYVTDQCVEFSKSVLEHRLSLRQALNISRNNIFNCFSSGWGPLWGKTKTLEEVEKMLNES